PAGTMIWASSRDPWWTCSSAGPRSPERPRSPARPWPPWLPCAEGSEMETRSGDGGTGEIRTLCDLFYDSVDRYRKPEHLRYKRGGEWRSLSSDELRRAVEELSLGLRSLGVERGDRVSILSENRPEWAFADLATLTAAAVDAPIYSTLTPPQ